MIKILLAALLIALINISYADEIPPSTKIVVINYEKALKQIGKSEEVTFKNYLASVAKQFNIQVILGSAARVMPDVDITNEAIQGFKSSELAGELKLKNLNNSPSVAIVNSEKVFKEFNGSTLEERNKIAAKGNGVLNQYASFQGISLIFQEAAYSNPEYEITSDVIGLMKGEKALTQMEKRQSFQRPVKIAVIQSETIFNESNYGEIMKQTLVSEFRDRQNILIEEASQIKAEAANGVSSELRNRDNLLIEKQKTFQQDLDKRTFEERAKIASKANTVIEAFAKSNDVGIIFQNANYVDVKNDITKQIMVMLNKGVTVPTVIQAPKAIESSNSPQKALDASKNKCLELGFKDNTEAFGKCVIRLSK